jgi:exodeoxyribonuclease VII small subunit
MAKEKISYDESVSEIEMILGLIEGGTLEVDELAAKVDRVTTLLKICREKLRKTEDQINQILEDKS